MKIQKIKKIIPAAQRLGNTAPKKRRSVGGTVHDLTGPTIKIQDLSQRQPYAQQKS